MKCEFQKNECKKAGSLFSEEKSENTLSKTWRLQKRKDRSLYHLIPPRLALATLFLSLFLSSVQASASGRNEKQSKEKEKTITFCHCVVSILVSPHCLVLYTRLLALLTGEKK